MIHALEAFRPFVEGYPIEIVTDHASLRWILSLKNPNGRLARWASELKSWNLTITHRKGNLMQAPDALSRNPVDVALVDLPDTITDVWYRGLVQKVQENPENFENFCMKDGYLLKSIAVGSKEPLRWVQLVPSDARAEALRQAHDAPTSGHGGNYKTFSRLRKTVYWPRMRRDVQEYVKNCQVCQQHKIDRSGPAGTMGGQRQVSEPFTVISSDLVGPFPRSTNGHKYILVTTDFLTKYVILNPLREATARAVADCMERDVFLRYEVPKEVIVDNGPQFQSRQFQDLCASYHSIIRYTVPYSPRSNPTERVNQTLEVMICCFLQANHAHWDRQLPYLAYAINSSESHATGRSPHQLVFGVDVPLDGRDRRHSGRDNEPLETDPRVIQDASKTDRDRFIEQARKNLQLAHEKNQRRYNLRRREVLYSEGQYLWRKFMFFRTAQRSSPQNSPLSGLVR